MNPRSSKTIVVNGITLDFAAGILRDSQGKDVVLRSQAFAVLEYLSRHTDRVVTKDELMQAIWPGIAVTDDSLVQCIGDIRRALRDKNQMALKVVPKRGYRLAIDAAEWPIEPTGRSRSAAIIALAIALFAAGLLWGFNHRADESGAGAVLPSVAVLPFGMIGGDADQQRLADGLTEDIITDLARFPEFRVIASNTTTAYKEKTSNTKEVGAALNAAFVVEGSIQRQADRVRITAQLVETATGKHIWSDRWDRPENDFFAIQTEIAEQVSNRLGGGAGLIQVAGRREAHRKPPANLNAYELYLLGTERLERVNRDDLEEAIRLLTRSLELDPSLARAWIELSHAHKVLAGFGVEPLRNQKLAADAAMRAVTLDPGDAEAHVVRAITLAESADLAKAKAEFDTALSMAPNEFEILTFYVTWAAMFGEPERGAELADRAISLNPNFPIWSTRPLNVAYFWAGRYEDALRMTDRLGPDNYDRWVGTFRAAALAALGRTDEARTLVAFTLQKYPDLSIEGIIANLPFTEVQRNRLIETMSLAGFPRCAKSEDLAKLEKPVRLPGCKSP
ncbi:MAG: adenylate/guanylate cyclase domain-containing protein [Mesorhizobium sp.]|uniref:winged helix-turn-helix domain-containing tetratricopeptide repeat protein n=1 Tax=Mesorhizobium sp. TaxID=1871066 RepID=UPI000FE67412|nr:winged helix-turn-helix domain-containing protein [Mesorhizobium sp.]RWD60948.1 MAG: adenylate/guanylate cyclase domain-containing protein [Mesorhizobium sp.]RWE50713.1 MAG: adenylate/guanylate cyclase domain-containing protein [Mesorhizobium sp.]